ncbi:hypothetical protein Egran_00235 [Elaphomyces granulatus]|uniref:GPI mannosyltransferase 1 n=1 Tax=Elaphomyces granulatus TaxID=519963 RepID=A0A232M6T5_9EURO|nr:hypothetical protein Egran_00235 [Elaphomyces granulatus]
MMSSSLSLFNFPARVFSAAAALRVGLLFYGLYQDAHSPVKYTDIDYMVFTDAARFVSRGSSPYARDTYRYTPLLAWILLPTSWTGPWGLHLWFSFGKAFFAVADLVAGWLIMRVLQLQFGMDRTRALKYASIWLLNPMVATISTRGSSEGLLGVMVVALLWAVTQRHIPLAGLLLGIAVHFKIYPFIYAPSLIWWLDAEREPAPRVESDEGSGKTAVSGFVDRISDFLTPSRVALGLTALSTFSALNLSMYMLYGLPFMQHTYLHHLTRVDHRHNFSPYNILLYLSAARGTQRDGVNFESLAFIPQLFISAMAIPLVLARKSLPGAMLAQTFAFVTFNKVCTSQYFLWYLILLPFYLSDSSFLKRPALGISAVFLWALSQTIWLGQGFRLEFLGISSFVPGLWLASLAFFAVNVWILGVIITDVGSLETAPRSSNDNMSAKTAFATGEAVLASGAAFGLSPRDELDETRRRTISDYIQQLEEFQELDDEEEVDE